MLLGFSVWEKPIIVLGPSHKLLKSWQSPKRIMNENNSKIRKSVKIANKRLNSSNEEAIKRENLNNVTKQLEIEKRDLQNYINKELDERKWGYRGRIKKRETESNERQDKLSNQIDLIIKHVSTIMYR